MFHRRLNGMLLGLTIAGCALSGNVVAEPEMSADDRWLLAKYDQNGDHVISVDEVEEKRKRIFSGMDVNADGGVSFDEYQQIDSLKRAQLLKARFSKLDLDQDGKLTNNEYCSFLGGFERFDQNGDGTISSSEMMNGNASDTLIDDQNSEQESALASDVNVAASADDNQVKDKKHDGTMCLLWFCVRKNMR